MPELSGPLFDISQSVRRDGLEMFLVYNSINGPFTNGDLWVSTRETTSQPWSKPVSLGPAINTDADDSFPSLSCEGTELFFASTRPGGAGGEDLYVATRKSLEALVSEPLLLSTSADGKGTRSHPPRRHITGGVIGQSGHRWRDSGNLLPRSHRRRRRCATGLHRRQARSTPVLGRKPDERCRASRYCIRTRDSYPFHLPRPFE